MTGALRAGLRREEDLQRGRGTTDLLSAVSPGMLERERKSEREGTGRGAESEMILVPLREEERREEGTV